MLSLPLTQGLYVCAFKGPRDLRDNVGDNDKLGILLSCNYGNVLLII